MEWQQSHVARHMGMHVTDAAAAAEILRADTRRRPLTPARLGERIGLTSGATSLLLTDSSPPATSPGSAATQTDNW